MTGDMNAFSSSPRRGFALIFMMIVSVILGGLALLAYQFAGVERRTNRAHRHRVAAWYQMSHLLQQLTWEQNTYHSHVRFFDDPAEWVPTSTGSLMLKKQRWITWVKPSPGLPFEVEIIRYANQNAEPPIRLSISVALGGQSVSQEVRFTPMPLDFVPFGFGPRSSGPDPEQWVHSFTGGPVGWMNERMSLPSAGPQVSIFLSPRQFRDASNFSVQQLRWTPEWPLLESWFPNLTDHKPASDPLSCGSSPPNNFKPDAESQILNLDDILPCSSYSEVSTHPEPFSNVIFNRTELALTGTLSVPCHNQCLNPYVLWIVNLPGGKLRAISPVMAESKPGDPCQPRIVIINFGQFLADFQTSYPILNLDLFSQGPVQFKGPFGLVGRWEGSLYLDGPYTPELFLDIQTPRGPYLPVHQACSFHHWLWGYQVVASPFDP